MQRGLDARGWLSLVLLVATTACTTDADILSTPDRVQVWINGRAVAERTPYHVSVRRHPFAWGGDVRVRLRAAGFRPAGFTLHQVSDLECRHSITSTALLGLPLLFPVFGLLYLPWCTRLEPARTDVDLRVLPKAR